MTAPIVLFVFARPEHTRRTIEALKNNFLADQSDLIIYSDAARNEDERRRVESVRDIISKVSGFRSVSIIERDINNGLSKNICEGVADACNLYGRAIVIEDDIVTSPYFLAYMNKALDRYVNDKEIWHISGWNYPVDTDGLGDAFFWRLMNCWGWATWADRWKYYSKDPDRLISTWNKCHIKRFNLDGFADFWGQIKGNQSGKIDTWAIFWYATIFEHNGLCLNPSKTLVQNIGVDLSGENCGDAAHFTSESILEEVPGFPPDMEESVLAVQRVKQFYKNFNGSLARKIIRRIKRIIKY